MGIEPTQSAWKAEILPLNYTRRKDESGVNPKPLNYDTIKHAVCQELFRKNVSLDKTFFGCFALHAKNKKSTDNRRCFSGALAGNRTPDNLIKSQVLYLLSYKGVHSPIMIAQKRKFVKAFLKKCAISAEIPFLVQPSAPWGAKPPFFRL